MIDEGASFRMRRSIVEVGSSSPLSGDSRAGASLQVLGVPNKPVQFSSTDRQFDASAGPAHCVHVVTGADLFSVRILTGRVMLVGKYFVHF